MSGYSVLRDGNSKTSRLGRQMGSSMDRAEYHHISVNVCKCNACFYSIEVPESKIVTKEPPPNSRQVPMISTTNYEESLDNGCTTSLPLQSTSQLRPHKRKIAVEVPRTRSVGLREKTVLLFVTTKPADSPWPAV